MNPWRAWNTRSRAAVALGVLLLAGGKGASAAPASAHLDEAVVSIFVSSLLSNGRGTGFGVGDGSWVVTCFHVVNQHVGDEKELPVEQVLVLSPWSGEPVKAHVVAMDQKADLALLKLEHGHLPALPVATAAQFNPDHPASESERFTIAGYGQTSTQIETQPEVKTGAASAELLAAAQKADRQVLLFVPGSSAGPGWSGGPVVNARGQVVGVFRALVAQPQAQDVWYPLATGAEPLRDLLKSQSIPLAPAGAPPKRSAEAATLFGREFRALACGSARHWDRAEAERRAELTLRPDAAIPHLGLSLSLMGQGRLEEALKEADAAVTLEPTRAGAYFQKGLILQRLNRLEEAEACMRQAVEMEPDAAERRISLGVLLANGGKTAAANAQFRRAIELSPNHPLAHWRLGLGLQTEGKTAEALASLRRAAKLAAPLAPLRTIRVDLAEALRNAGQPEEAERELRDLARDGDDASVQYQLAALLASRQKPAEALQALRKCLSLLDQNTDPELLKRANELKTKLEGKTS
jgi:tetratricopeptide (TPR) repeat protein